MAQNDIFTTLESKLGLCLESIGTGMYDDVIERHLQQMYELVRRRVPQEGYPKLIVSAYIEDGSVHYNNILTNNALDESDTRKAEESRKGFVEWIKN
jgi:hypothetical protein